MSKPGLSYGLNLGKKAGTKPGPSKLKTGGIFGGGDDSDSDHSNNEAPTQPNSKSKSRPGGGAPPPKPKKAQLSAYGDLSSALESRKNQEAAEELDPTIYDYDGVYETMKRPSKSAAAARDDAERRPKYMKNLVASAAVRKRDAVIAEEKKIARERAAEGDEFEGRDQFVTEAYKRQQEENRRLEEEERRREEDEARKNKGGGMTAFYKDLLNQGDRRHAEMMKAVKETAKNGAPEGGAEDGDEDEEARTQADKAREINAQGGSIAINADGEVVDKRELLKGGLNVVAKKKPEVRREERKPEGRDDGRDSRGFVGTGGKQAMRERQSRMLEAQLEQSLKRSLEDEEEERRKVEKAAKSRKTEGEISSAKERYLARKRAAEEEKKKQSGS